jgi:hypothetical protein
VLLQDVNSFDDVRERLLVGVIEMQSLLLF